jgi:hypothetical protein
MAPHRSVRAWAPLLSWLLALPCGSCVPPNGGSQRQGVSFERRVVEGRAGAVQGRASSAPLGGLSPEERDAEFEFVVEVLRDSYAHLELKEHQWGVRLAERSGAHAARVRAATDLREYYAALAEFLAEFHDGHLRLVHDLPPYGPAARPVRAGFETRFLAGRLLVSDVWPRSHAAGAGLRPGDEIIAVDGETVPELLARFQKGGSWSRIERARFLFEKQWSIRAIGPNEATPALPITRRRRDGSYDTLRVTLEGESAYHLGTAPVQLHELTGHYRLELRTLLLERSQIEAAMHNVRERLASAPLPVLIDLRDNPGGYDNAARVVAGSFTARGVTGAALRMRLSKRVLDHRPAWETLPRDPRRPEWSTARPFHAPGLAAAEYPLPLAVLTDAGCISSCETLALLLRALGARLFGTRTAGSSGGPIQVRLPHSGATLTVPVWSVEDLAGHPLEGLGVAPDEPVEIDPDHLGPDADDAAHAALSWLRSGGGLHRAADPRKLGSPCAPPSSSSTSTAR